MKISSVCVYCASSSKIDNIYFEAAAELGKALAENGIRCVCGAGNQGLMGALTDSVLVNGGSMKGVIPQFMIDEGWHHKGISEMIVTENMHERKELMAKSAEAAIAMPGGCGTMEELLEIITWKQLGLYFGPIVILNINGFYDDLIKMLDKAISESFMREDHRNMWSVAQTVSEAIAQLDNSEPWHELPRKIAAI